MIVDFFRTEQLSELNTISIDSVIMDNYYSGLKYFSNIILRFKDQETDTNINIAKKYLETYLSTYIEENMSIDEFKENINEIITIHKTIIDIKLSNNLIQLWLNRLYFSILDLVKEDYLNINHFTDLFLCPKFRDYFYLKELNFLNLTGKSLLYNLIKNTKNFRDINQIISIFVLNKDYLGNYFLFKWLEKILIFCNVINNLTDVISKNNSHDIFFIKSVAFTYHIWFNFYKNIDIRINKHIYYYFIKLVDVTITPIMMKINLLQNRIDFLSELNNNNILEYRNTVYKKNLQEINLLLEKNHYVFDKIMFFFNYYSIKLIYCGEQTIKKNNNLIEIIQFFIYNSKNNITKNHKINNIIIVLKNRLNHLKDKLSIYRSLIILYKYSNISTKLDLLPKLVNIYCNNDNKLLISEKLNLLECISNYKNKLLLHDDSFISGIIDILNEICLKIKERHQFILENNSFINKNTTFIQNKNIDNLCLCLDLLDFILKYNDKQQLTKILHLYNFLIPTLIDLDKFNNKNQEVCVYNKLSKIDNFIIKSVINISEKQKINEDILPKLSLEKLLKIENKLELMEEIQMELPINIEIPEEFCDPILYNTIIEPIYVPNSNSIMDKSVIFTHLENYNDNPFSGDPLTKEEVMNYNNKQEIKEKINDFIIKRDTWFKNNNIPLK